MPCLPLRPAKRSIWPGMICRQQALSVPIRRRTASRACDRTPCFLTDLTRVTSGHCPDGSACLPQAGALPRQHARRTLPRSLPKQGAAARPAGLPVEAPPGRCRSAQARWQGAIRWRCGPVQAAPDRREGAVAPARGGGRARPSGQCPDLTGVKSGVGGAIIQHFAGNSLSGTLYVKHDLNAGIPAIRIIPASGKPLALII